MSVPCRNIPWIQEGTSIVMQVFMIFTFLTTFFFLYVVKVEKTQFLHQVDLVVDDIMADWGRLFGPQQKGGISPAYMKQLLQGLVANRSPSSSNQKNERIDQQNEQVKHLAEKFLAIFGVGLLVAISILVFFRICVQPVYYFFNNLLVLFFIATVEFLFLTLVASQYISADPNKIKTYILNSLAKFAQQQKGKK